MEEARVVQQKSNPIAKENTDINNTSSSKKYNVDLHNSKRKTINSTDLKMFEDKNSKSVKSSHTYSKDRITVNFSKNIFYKKKRLSR